jgi:predicted HicB family RNase H-like nuclease
MKDNSAKQSKTRMIHIRLPGGIHKKVRIRAAESDKTIQDWVVEAIENELKRQIQSSPLTEENNDD